MGGSDDLGLSIISGDGGWLMVNLIRSANSGISSVDGFRSQLSSSGPSKRPSAVMRTHDCSRFNFRREVTFVAVPNITPPPITLQVSWWGLIDALSESEVVPDLQCVVARRKAGDGDMQVSLSWLALVAEISLTLALRRRLFAPRTRLSLCSKLR